MLQGPTGIDSQDEMCVLDPPSINSKFSLRCSSKHPARKMTTSQAEDHVPRSKASTHYLFLSLFLIWIQITSRHGNGNGNEMCVLAAPSLISKSCFLYREHPARNTTASGDHSKVSTPLSNPVLVPNLDSGHVS